MCELDIPRISYTGMQVGLGIALVPVAVTTLIACSKIIFVNIIAEIVVRILTGNTMSVSVTGIEFIAVPLLWQISGISAIVGGSIIALSLIAALVNTAYRHCRNTQPAN